MLKGYAKQFFWTSSIIGMIIVGTQVSKKLHISWGDAPPVTFNENDDTGLNSKVDIMAMLRASKNSRNPVVSESGKLMVWRGKTYIKIEKDWYEERKDHIYNVKGVKTYYTDSSRVRSRLPAGAMKVAVESADEKSSALLNKLSKNPFSAYSPDQVGDAMQALQDAKAQNAERNKVLNELSR